MVMVVAVEHCGIGNDYEMVIVKVIVLTMVLVVLVVIIVMVVPLF